MTQLNVITEGLRFPEGPIAMADGSVLLVEIRRATLTRVDTDGSQEIVADFGDPASAGPNGAAIGPDGAVYVCNNGGMVWTRRGEWDIPMELRTGVTQTADYRTGSIDRVDLATGEITTLYTECDGQRLRSPNDLVFDSTGGFWFTDHGKTRAGEIDRCGVYYARPDGSSIRRSIFPLHQPNGIGLSPAGDTLYVAETPTGRLWAFEVVGPGELGEANPSRARNLANTLGLFDSLAVEADGTVVVAAIGDGLCLARPDGEVSFVAMPDPITTNVCFGGPDRTTAYVTLSAGGRLVSMEWPRPGLALAFES